jgi:hypothetical protein
MTILFDETLFGHINGPSELLVSSPADPDSDMVHHTPAIPAAPEDSSTESFVLRCVCMHVWRAKDDP